jgi:hypothetical protein
MKFINYLAAIWLTLFLVACGGGGGNPGLPTGLSNPVKTTAPATITLSAGATQNFSIISGRAPYQISSSNLQVAVAAMNGSGFLLGGVSNGVANIVITDAAAQSITIEVTVRSAVALYTTAPSSLTMVPRASREFVIGGGQPPYTVVSDNTLVASTDGSVNTVLRINSNKIGTTNIKISDAVNATANIRLTVSSGSVALAISPASASTFVNFPVDVVVIGGNPPYRVGGLIPAAAEVVQDPVDNTKFTVTPFLVSSGLDISFIDSENAVVKFTLTVNAGQPTFRLSPNTLSVSEVFRIPFNLTAYGSTGAISAFSSDLTLFSVTVSGNTVKVTPRAKCVAENTDVTISVVDSSQAYATAIITVIDNGNTAEVVGPPAVAASNCPP